MENATGCRGSIVGAIMETQKRLLAMTKPDVMQKLQKAKTRLIPAQAGVAIEKPSTKVTNTNAGPDNAGRTFMKSAQEFEARIDQDLTLTERARAARLKYVRELLKSAYNPVVRGIQTATTSVDISVSERGPLENG
jgi:hypothetical protein